MELEGKVQFYHHSALCFESILIWQKWCDSHHFQTSEISQKWKVDPITPQVLCTYWWERGEVSGATCTAVAWYSKPKFVDRFALVGGSILSHVASSDQVAFPITIFFCPPSLLTWLALWCICTNPHLSSFQASDEILYFSIYWMLIQWVIVLFHSKTQLLFKILTQPALFCSRYVAQFIKYIKKRQPSHTPQ